MNIKELQLAIETGLVRPVRRTHPCTNMPIVYEFELTHAGRVFFGRTQEVQCPISSTAAMSLSRNSMNYATVQRRKRQ